MKKTIKYLAFTFAISLAFLVGCSEFTDKIDDFNVGVTNAIFEQSAVLELKDYFGHQEDITNTNFTLEFSGEDADKLVNEAGEFTLTETDGFIQLNVNPNKSIGVKELNFDATISGGTYRTKTFNVSLKDTTSHIPLTIVNNSRIKGANSTTTSSTLVNNATTTAVNIITAKTNTTTNSKVTINSGTLFKDEAGNTLLGTNVIVDVTNIDGIAEFIDPQFKTEKTFTDEQGKIITDKLPRIVNRTRIDMAVGGKSVKEFNKPIQVVVEVADDPSFPLNIGDTYPIYTTEKNSDDWKFHENGIVTAGTNNNTFNIVFSTIHLSDYAILHFEESPTIEESCKDSKWNITAPNATGTGVFTIKLEEKVTYFQDMTSATIVSNLFKIYFLNGKIIYISSEKDGTAFEGGSFIHTSYNNYFNIYTFFKSKQTNFGQIIHRYLYQYRVLLYFGDNYIGDDFSSFTNATNCEINMNLSANLVTTNLKTINVDLAADCNGKNFIPDGFPIYVERENGNFTYQGTLKKGKVKLNGFELNKEYNFKTLYKGKSYFHKWTFTSETFTDKNFQIPDGVCDEIGL